MVGTDPRYAEKRASGEGHIIGDFVGEGIRIAELSCIELLEVVFVCELD